MINVAKNLDKKKQILLSKDLETGDINLQDLKKKLNKKTLAVVVTNIFNSPSSLFKIKKFISKKRLF